MSREGRRYPAHLTVSATRSRGEWTTHGVDGLQRTVETERPRDRMRQSKVKHGVSGEAGRDLGVSMPTQREGALDAGKNAEVRLAEQRGVWMSRGGTDDMQEPKRTGADKRDVHCSSRNDDVGQQGGLWMRQDEGSLGEGGPHSGDTDEGDGNEQMAMQLSFFTPTAQASTPQSTPARAEGYRTSPSQTREVDGNPWLGNTGVDSGLWTAQSNQPLPSAETQKSRAQTVRQPGDGRGDDGTADDGESCGRHEGTRVGDRIPRKDAGEEGGEQVRDGATGPLYSNFDRWWTSSFA